MTPPGRSILSLASCDGRCGTDGCPAVEILCDCGTATHLTVEFTGKGKGEAAFTCDGCLTVTWFTVTA